MKYIDLSNVKWYCKGTLAQGWLNPILNFALLEIESNNNQTLFIWCLYQSDLHSAASDSNF